MVYGDKMDFQDHIFKTYDIRGKFPHDFSSTTAMNLGKCLGNHFGISRNIVIGGDVRISSPLIKSALTTGLLEAGCNVLDVGICTTPTIYFLAANNEEINGGIMVTASHNPIEYNGIKVCNEDGISFHINNLFQEVKRKLKGNLLSSAPIMSYGKQIIPNKINNDQYWTYQNNSFNPSSKLVVGVEIGNGTCFPILSLLESKGLIVKSLHSEPDGRFPIMIPDPAKESSLKFLKELIKEQKIDVGIGFDADGDRIGFIDEKGNIVNPDQVIMLFGKYLLEKSPKSEILIDIKTSRATYEYLTKIGATVSFTKVGHSWIHETLLKKGAIFAGELSGHYYFGLDYYGFDDAVYSALRMIEILSKSEKSFSELLKRLPAYPSTEEIRIHCPEEIKSKVVSNLVELLTKEAVNFITIDGIRAEFEDGWILIRQSGTEPVISARAEANNLSKLNEYRDYIQELITGEIERLT